MNDLTFRECAHGSEDYLACVRLRREVLRWPLGLDFTEEQLAGEARDVHLGVFDQGECIGCLVLTPEGDLTVHMRQVAVTPTRQGSGIGGQMVRWSEEKARELGFRRMILHARESAVHFYLKLGYRIEGEPFVEVTLPHRLMIREL